MAASSPSSSCFLPVPADSPFSIHNLPFGVFTPPAASLPRPGIAIGDFVLDLSAIAASGLFTGPLLSSSDCFRQVCPASLLANFGLRRRLYIFLSLSLSRSLRPIASVRNVSQERLPITLPFVNGASVRPYLHV
jgi:hypothetical protein